MSSYTRLTSVDLMLRQDNIERMGKNNIKSFTRNRKMNFYDLTTSILLKKGQTLTLELNEFTEKMKKPTITKQAYSKQRQNLNPEVFKHINREYIKKIYEEIEVETYKGYVVLSVDGSGIELPNCETLKKYYGVTEGQKGSVGRVRGKALGIYDSLNKIMINTTINPNKKSEKEQFLEQIDELIEFMEDKKYIIVFDRYYFGLSFINTLEEKGIKYIMRLKLKDYKKEKEEMKTNDEIVKLKIRTNSIFYAKESEKEKLKNKKNIETRIIKTKLKNGIEEHLSTNMSKEELTEEEAKELYFTRWNIEKSFDIIKNKINIENFSTKTVIGIEQEFYAQMLVYNMLEDLKRDAGERIENNSKKKYKYKINMNIMAGIFKRKYIEILIIKDEKEKEKKYIEMINTMSKYLVPIKPGRKFERKKMHSMNKYRSNLRRNI